MILEFEASYVEMNEGSSSSQVVVTPSHSEFISDTQISTSTETMQPLASSPSASDLPRPDPEFRQQHSKKEKGVSTECSVQTEPVEQTPKRRFCQSSYHFNMAHLKHTAIHLST